jgi:hypothetical protein
LADVDHFGLDDSGMSNILEFEAFPVFATAVEEGSFQKGLLRDAPRKIK